MPTRRLLVAIAFFACAVTAFAQPLRAPNFYLFQVPRLEAGQPVSATLTTAAGQNFKDGSYLDVYAFAGRSGDQVSVIVSSWEFDAYVTMFDPDGYLVALNDDYAADAGTAGIDATLYMDGTYLVVVSGYSQWDLGAYTVELTTAAAGLPAETRSITVPGAFESLITSDMGLHPNGYVGRTEYVSFTVEDESLLLIDATSYEFDTVLTLFDEFGNEIAQNDDYGDSSDSRLAVPLAPGAYVLAVSSYYADEFGSYAVSVERYVQAR